MQQTKDDLEFLSDDPNVYNSIDPMESWKEQEVLNLNAIPIEITDESKREYLGWTENDVNEMVRDELLEKERADELREELAAEEVEEALANRRSIPTLIIENEEGDDEDEEAEDNSIVPLPQRDSSPGLFTEGGVVFLNNNPKRFLFTDNEDPAEVEAEFESAFNGVGAPDLRNSGFERRERLDVKKPGPWYRTVNNFAFDYEEEAREKEIQARLIVQIANY